MVGLIQLLSTSLFLRDTWKTPNYKSLRTRNHISFLFHHDTRFAVHEYWDSEICNYLSIMLYMVVENTNLYLKYVNRYKWIHKKICASTTNSFLLFPLITSNSEFPSLLLPLHSLSFSRYKNYKWKDGTNSSFVEERRKLKEIKHDKILTKD